MCRTKSRSCDDPQCLRIEKRVRASRDNEVGKAPIRLNGEHHEYAAFNSKPTRRLRDPYAGLQPLESPD